MAIETWADILVDAVEVGAAIDVNDLDQVRANMLTGRDQGFKITLAELPTSPPAADTFEKLIDFEGLWIPGWGRKLVIAVEAKVDAGTGTLKFQLDGSDSSFSATFTNTAFSLFGVSYNPTVIDMTINGAPVTGNVRTEVTLSLWAKNSGVNKTYARSIQGAVCHWIQE